jgi:arylsulfatase A-like enzyme
MNFSYLARRIVRTSTACVSLAAAAVSAQTAKTPQRLPQRPNIVVIALDDVGFSDLGAYGSEIHTPNIDSIAKAGLRYTNFQSKAVCSPTRASLMTGRNPQTVGMWDLPDRTQKGLEGVPPKTTGVIPANAEMLPEALRRVGYTTMAVGKWHLTPRYQDGTPGNNSTMPLQRGFDSFYGYKLGWTDQYHPELWNGNTPLADPYKTGYYLAEDLAAHAVASMKQSQADDPSKPMFLYLAMTFAHAPLQAPKEYIDHYKDTYQKGWDAIRTQRFARQRHLGVLPPNATLPPRDAGDPSWDSLTDQQRRVYARFMATYAGYIEHGDAQIGKVLAYLRSSGLDKNTVIVLFSDNGSASETKTGGFRTPYSDTTTLAQMDEHLDELGSVTTQPLYQRPWAYSGATPFRRYKLWPYFGGVRTPMMIDIPGSRIKDAGGTRNQVVDVIDVAPTLLQLAGTQFQSMVDGKAQVPVAGTSFLSTTTSAAAPATRNIQFFEMRGNRAILSGDWRAIAMHRFGTSFESDTWQLFNVKADPSESTDVAAKYPAKLKELKDLWQQQARKYGDLPLLDTPYSKGFADAFLD